MSDNPTAYDAVIVAPFGLVGIRTRGEALAEIVLEPHARRRAPPRTAAARRAAAALERYFSDPADVPSLDLEIGGTPFQRRVWNALRRIPCGTTLSYGELARKLGTSARAVGGACRENPVPIFVPCHRVVGAGGAGGFMGQAMGRPMEIKSWLLRHEERVGCGERD